MVRSPEVLTKAKSKGIQWEGGKETNQGVSPIALDLALAKWSKQTHNLINARKGTSKAESPRLYTRFVL